MIHTAPKQNIWLAVGLAVLLTMLSGCDVRVGDAGPAARRQACRHNLRALGKFLRAYVTDHDALPHFTDGQFDFKEFEGCVNKSLKASHPLQDYVTNKAISPQMIRDGSPTVPIIVDDAIHHQEPDGMIVANGLMASGHVRTIHVPAKEYRCWLQQFRCGNWHDGNPYSQN